MSEKFFSGSSRRAAQMNRSIIRKVVLSDTGQYLLIISATMSLPPVLPPYLRIRPMPRASRTPANMGTSTFSSM